MLSFKNTCCIPNCTEKAIYGTNNDTNKPYWCSTHIQELFEATPNEIYFKTKVNSLFCRNEFCDKKASFNFLEKKKAIFCKDHKKENMINKRVTKLCSGIHDEKCSNIPSYGLIGGLYKDALYCSKCFHKLGEDKDKYEDVVHKKCKNITNNIRCKKNPCFSYQGENAMYCSQHALKDMINVIDNKCIYEEILSDNQIMKCNKIATYGKIDSRTKLYCHIHSLLEGDCEDKSHKKCEYIYENDQPCDSRAIYGNVGTGEKKFCRSHASNDMIDNESVLCSIEKCKKRAIYGYISDRKKLFCTEHSKGVDNIHNLILKYCIFKNLQNENCLHKATFNLIGLNKSYCYLHKTDGMINLSRPICIFQKNIHEKCSEYAYYNYFGENKLLYCYKHKLSNMVYINKNTCIFMDDDKGCSIRPSFNYPGEYFPIFCSNHAEENMIDIINEKCVFQDSITGEKCNQYPSFNYPDKKKRIYCNIHKQRGMINISKKICIYNECCEKAIYNITSEYYPRFCYLHKTDDMVHKNKNICKTLLCETDISSFKYSDDYCIRCYSNLFPDEIISKNYRIKEKEVSNYIKKSFTLNIQYNKTIIGGKSSRRPDIFITLPNHYIIIEIDENQHQSYKSSSENQRITEISQDVNFKNIVFIRFNPDQYYDLHKNKIDTCWRYDNGKCVISNISEWNKRLETLSNTVKYWIDNTPNKMIEIIQLFYDQF